MLTLLCITADLPQSQSVPEGLIVFVGGGSATTTREEFELEQCLFEKDKWCLFRPTGGCKGKIRAFAGWNVARSHSVVQLRRSQRSSQGKADKHMPIWQLPFLLCFPILSSSVDTKHLSSCNTINKSIRPPVFIYRSPSTSRVMLLIHNRPLLPRFFPYTGANGAVVADHVEQHDPVWNPWDGPRGDKDDTLKLLLAVKQQQQLNRRS